MWCPTRQLDEKTRRFPSGLQCGLPMTVRPPCFTRGPDRGTRAGPEPQPLGPFEVRQEGQHAPVGRLVGLVLDGAVRAEAAGAAALGGDLVELPLARPLRAEDHPLPVAAEAGQGIDLRVVGEAALRPSARGLDVEVLVPRVGALVDELVRRRNGNHKGTKTQRTHKGGWETEGSTALPFAPRSFVLCRPLCPLCLCGERLVASPPRPGAGPGCPWPGPPGWP